MTLGSGDHKENYHNEIIANRYFLLKRITVEWETKNNKEYIILIFLINKKYKYLLRCFFFSLISFIRIKSICIKSNTRNKPFGKFVWLLKNGFLLILFEFSYVGRAWVLIYIMNDSMNAPNSISQSCKTLILLSFFMIRKFRRKFNINKKVLIMFYLRK